ncbi:MAG TPA: gliding motility lipoprotein GldD, partial [Flavobacterium sp.]|nr:gliding motility lipoprotein GldD [Flavobacterium sp.]
MKRKIIFSSFFAFLLLLTSCKDDVLPKPSSQLRLDYPLASYATYSNGCPFTFDVNEDVTIKEDK